MAARFQIVTQRAIVVDLAVADQDNIAGFTEQRLASIIRRDNGKTAQSQRDTIVTVGTGLIRTTMRQILRHPEGHTGIRRSGIRERENTSYTTHAPADEDSTKTARPSLFEAKPL
jgi:hypothetical protein